MKLKIKILTMIMFFATISFAVSDYLTFQGKLTDSAGEPLDGSYDIKLNFYEVSSGGNFVWSTEVANVLIESGLYSIEISTDGIFNKEYWIEIGIKPAGGGTYEFFPRYRLTSSAYAFRSKYANQATSATYASSAGGFAINEHLNIGSFSIYGDQQSSITVGG
ncbi:MAG: hypothetical protein SNJ64_05525, partial [Endomicrobiia bacterium]